jgi:hypothetical protein
MTQQFTLTINISADGETVEGTITEIQGKACSNIARLLDKVGRELEHRHTDDYNAKAPVSIGGKAKKTVTARRW